MNLRTQTGQRRFVNTYGFTLIELLIVVAIIAILAAIAVPNFLEAQTRAKVGRCQADLRSMATAMEMYYLDNRKYPPYQDPWGRGGQSRWRLNHLSTPVAYISSIPSDVFASEQADPVSWAWHLDSYIYAEMSDWGLWNRSYKEAADRGQKWFLVSRGPNLLHDALTNTSNNETTYDPTNGTKSRGDVERFGP